jgi:hypothetical protein
MWRNEAVERVRETARARDAAEGRFREAVRIAAFVTRHRYHRVIRAEAAEALREASDAYQAAFAVAQQAHLEADRAAQAAYYKDLREAEVALMTPNRNAR